MINITKSCINIKKEEISMDLINIVEILKNKDEFECGEGQNEEQIAMLETKLQVIFPKSYRWIVKQYGYMAWSDGIILGPSNISHYDLMTINEYARSEELPKDFAKLPSDAFVIDRYPGGGYYMLFSADSPRAGQVGLFLDETFNHEEQTWDSLEAFLEDYYY